MANTKISDFTSGSPAQTTDEFVIARTGANFKLAGSDIKTLAVGAGSVSVASGKTLTASNTLTLAGTDATTMTFPSTSATLARTDAGNTFTGNQTVNGGTITADAPVLNLSQTWNASGVTFTGLRFNAATGSNAGSAAGSLLMDLQLEGASRFSVNKSGTIQFGPAANASQWVSQSNTNIMFNAAGSNRVQLGLGVKIGSGSIFQWSSTTDANDTGDLLLTRRAAANLRLGAADAAAPVAQTLSVQSVVAGTSNTAGANLTITGSQGTGTGAGGSIIFQVAPAGSSGTAQNALATALTIGSNRAVSFLSSGSSSTTILGNLITGSAGSGTCLVLLENNNIGLGGNNSYTMTVAENSGAPGVYLGANRFLGWSSNNASGSLNTSGDTILARDAANTLALRNGTNAQTFNVYNTFTSSTNFERFRIVAQSADTVLIGTEKGSGGGTARALELQTDGTSRWSIGATTGHLLAGADNTYDIGASGANRPRNVYVAGTYNSAATVALNNGNMQIVGSASTAYVDANDFVFRNYAGNAAPGVVAFGGKTSSFPALKRVSANLQVIAADNAGSAGLIVGNQALATTATDGFLYVPTCAGTPTGTPTTQTGTVPIVVDTTNNKLYFYSGAAWRDAGP